MTFFFAHPQQRTHKHPPLVHHKGYLHFADGTSFAGLLSLPHSLQQQQQQQRDFWGELAFTTSMTGFQESISDPSFLGQHILFATPHIGNYPAHHQAQQNNKGPTFAASVMARHFTPNPYWNELTVPLFSEFDTRAVICKITQSDPRKANNNLKICLLSLEAKAPAAKEFTVDKLFCQQLPRVSIAEPHWINHGKNPIVALDYGMKSAILQNLQNLPFPLVVLGHKASLAQILSFEPRMVFLSNGPGDPASYVAEIATVQGLLGTTLPLRAICLGHQLLALALGANSYPLPFGHRGSNHPVLDHQTGKVLITSQNHGYAIDGKNPIFSSGKDADIFISHSSLFDGSVEGLSSRDGRIQSVQFHPEANPGPRDALNFFAQIQQDLERPRSQWGQAPSGHQVIELASKPFKRQHAFQRVLVVGSGPIRIGQASEFDYSGTQACRTLKEEGLTVILLNSNPATIMTDTNLAHKTYIEPINLATVQKIILEEKVDAVLSTMGGQTALNLCLELEESGFLQQNNVQLLGANSATITKTENREIFSAELDKLGFKTGKRLRVQDTQQAQEAALKTLGLPVLVRKSFALGGEGARLIKTPQELEHFLQQDIKYPITLESSLVGYKEIELEIMIDCEQNGVVICSIENVDACGIHTGDSITVAPAQTISDICYQQLRDQALAIGKAMGVVAGGANVQFAIHPQDEDDITVIEMNPRVSRSSALASKATGYAIAKISTKLALGYTLKEILNDITKVSPVCFEPTLDYVAVKIPYFPFDKFPDSSRELGPQMRSVGEVLALGSNFKEAFMKALRSLELGLEIPHLSRLKRMTEEVTLDYVQKRLKQQEELSLLTALEGLRLGMSAQEIAALSHISPWFIEQMYSFSIDELQLQTKKQTQQNSTTSWPHPDPSTLRYYKQQGFSDRYLAHLTQCQEEEIFKWRLQQQITPKFKAVDTCSGEFRAQTPYFYSTYWEIDEAKPLSSSSIVILGSGPNRIGQGIEFDYSCVKAGEALRSEGHPFIMVNSNPETVSTDYDSSDRLYLAPLYAEDVFDVLWHENPAGVIAAFSGQTGIRVREELEKSFYSRHKSFPFLGGKLSILEKTEDRKQFDELLTEVPVHRTKSITALGINQIHAAIAILGLPVIIRPSYVIGGESMYIIKSMADLDLISSSCRQLIQREEVPFTVENYLEDAMEYDVDIVRDRFDNFIFTICEHIEYAGVHSGDSGMITPPVYLCAKLQRQILHISQLIARKLQVEGPINFQYAVVKQQIYCIEANPRGSRTIPFLAKAYQLPLPALAVHAMLGKPIAPFYSDGLPFFCVKQSTFPFERFLQDTIILGPRMRSTGETMGVDPDRDQAILKSYMANYPHIGKVGKILFSLSNLHKYILTPYLKPLHHLGYHFFATSGTCDFIRRHGLPCTKVGKIGEELQQEMSILDVIQNENIHIFFNTPMNEEKSLSNGAQMRMGAIQKSIACFTRPENIRTVLETIIGNQNRDTKPISLQELKR